MRWSYKTIHYELRKEGLLGSSFLDEAEVEESLNEYGHAGWELVSVIEMKDGLIAFLKQPLDQPVQSLVEEKPVRKVSQSVSHVSEPDQDIELQINADQEEQVTGEGQISSFEEWEKIVVDDSGEEKVDKPERTVGEIKIE